MPYAMPSPPSPDGPSLDLPPLKLKPKHRRTRSASASATFSNEPGQGAFVPLPGLPRRKSGERRAQFHFTDDQDSDSSDELPSVSSNTLGLTVDTRNIPPNASPPRFEVNGNKQTSSLPFPSRGSPLSSPQPPSPGSGSPMQRTPSTPIILSNGKPLKPSLKSSQSSPHLPEMRLHARAQSEPSTPCQPPKNVHFAEKDALQSVRVFNSSGKPVNVSRSATPADETETETEYDSSAAEPNRYPFPISPPILTFEIHPERSSLIPAANPPDFANVHFETLTLPTMRPPVLHGSIIVRNVAFSKDVAVRFTLDDWQTTSEVSCKYVASLPSLPPPFPTPTTRGDEAAAALESNKWDRFSFLIRLEDFERKLVEKTMWLVVRYTAPGTGEWWDNNSGANYRVSFRNVSPTASDSARFSPVMGNSQQRTFSAPATLKGTPTTEAVQAVASAQPATTPKLTMPLNFSLSSTSSRRHASSSPARPSTPIRSNSSPQPIAANQRASSPFIRSSLPSRLNLLNYAAPSRSPSSAHPPIAESPVYPSLGLPRADHDDGSSNRSSTSRESPLMTMAMIAGMPATGAPRYEDNWPLSTNSSSLSLPPSPPPSYSYLSPAVPPPSEQEIQRAKEIVSSPTASLASDSSYAAFVKQWCFAQSPTPSPGVQMSGERDLPLNGTSTPPHGQGRGNWRAIGVDSYNMYGGPVRGDSPMLGA